MDKLDTKQQPQPENSPKFVERLNAWDARRRLKLQSGIVVLFAKLSTTPDIFDGTDYDFKTFDKERGSLKTISHKLLTDNNSLNSVGGLDEMAKIVRKSYGNVIRRLIDISEKAKSKQDPRLVFREIARSLITNDFNALMVQSGGRQLGEQWMGNLNRLVSSRTQDSNRHLRDEISNFYNGDESIFKQQ